MKKVVILGCENSHADNFLTLFHKTHKEEFSDIEVIGVYSEEREAAEKLNAKFGVPIMEDYADGVGKVDGVIITARHGDNHYKYAKPYLDSGVPMFIDKPITVSEEEAVEFMRQLKERNIKVCGGSSWLYAYDFKLLRRACQQEEGGPTVGGIVRAPLQAQSPHGGFFFYSQHLVDILLASFEGRPHSVEARIDVNQNHIVLFYYDTYTVTGFYSEGGYTGYLAVRFGARRNQGGNVPSAGDSLSYAEMKEFTGLLNGEEQSVSYSDFIATVFIQNAIYRAGISGKVESVNYVEV